MRELPLRRLRRHVFFLDLRYLEFMYDIENFVQVDLILEQHGELRT